MALFQKILLPGILLFFVQSSFSQSQVAVPVQQLQDYSRRDIPDGFSPRLNVLTHMPKGNLHYLYPFYHAFRDEIKFKKIYSDKGYYDELSQYFSFAGDYLTAMQYLVNSYDSVDDAARRKVYKTVEGLNGIIHADARRYIHLLARTHRVIMINEAYSKPQHRVFTMSLLADLYKQGFRYLAMEMLNNYSSHTLTRESMHTGYYATEPVAGELVRSALSMGYTLVSYEDTAAAVHTVNQRDSIQAQNIYKIIQQDTAAKILVHAEYAHISKKMGADGYVPMGLAFRQISGIDPYSIDQTDMTEESNFAYGRVFYQAYLQKYPLKMVSVALLNNEAVNVTNNDLYDLTLIHPPTIYQDGRPSWLSLDGERKATYVKSPTVEAFLVQAYYEEEVEQNENTPWQLVPADQTYISTGKKSYQLFLKKGKYRVYFRDINYHILTTLTIEFS